MSAKSARQNQILSLISHYEIETQDELCARLIASGFKVTQATVSRDMRELKLMKGIGPGGRMRYIRNTGESVEDSSLRQMRVFKEAVKEVLIASTILVIKTNSGMASAVGAAVDGMGIKEIVGSIAGDDTLFCAMNSMEDAGKVRERLLELLKN